MADLPFCGSRCAMKNTSISTFPLFFFFFSIFSSPSVVVIIRGRKARGSPAHGCPGPWLAEEPIHPPVFLLPLFFPLFFLFPVLTSSVKSLPRGFRSWHELQSRTRWFGTFFRSPSPFPSPPHGLRGPVIVGVDSSPACCGRNIGGLVACVLFLFFFFPFPRHAAGGAPRRRFQSGADVRSLKRDSLLVPPFFPLPFSPPPQGLTQVGQELPVTSHFMRVS